MSSPISNSIERFDSDGLFLDTFSATEKIGQEVVSPYDLVFGPDENLYVSSYDTDSMTCRVLNIYYLAF